MAREILNFLHPPKIDHGRRQLLRQVDFVGDLESLCRSSCESFANVKCVVGWFQIGICAFAHAYLCICIFMHMPMYLCTKSSGVRFSLIPTAIVVLKYLGFQENDEKCCKISTKNSLASNNYSLRRGANTNSKYSFRVNSREYGYVEYVDLTMRFILSYECHHYFRFSQYKNITKFSKQVPDGQAVCRSNRFSNVLHVAKLTTINKFQ